MESHRSEAARDVAHVEPEPESAQGASEPADTTDPTPAIDAASASLHAQQQTESTHTTAQTNIIGPAQHHDTDPVAQADPAAPVLNAGGPRTTERAAEPNAPEAARDDSEDRRDAAQDGGFLTDDETESRSA
jgi:segregation and condensation protein B